MWPRVTHSQEMEFLRVLLRSGAPTGSGAKLVGIESGVISGLNLASQIRRLAAAVGDNANDDRYSKYFGW
jgi:hypothetical protein